MQKFIPLLLLALTCCTCVSKKTYLTEQRAAAAADSLARVQITELRESLAHARGANQALRTTEDKLQARLDVLQLEIDRLNQNASSTRQDTDGRLQDKDREIAARQARLDAIGRLLTTRADRLRQLQESLPAAFTESGLESGWEVAVRNGRLVIALQEDILLRKNSTSAFTDSGSGLLDRVARLIARYPEMTVIVVGHTDNVPINREGIGNWQYSALRAVSVVKALTGTGALGANRVLAAGKSEYEPLESNETEAGRRRNRRVELIVAPREADLERELRKVLEN